VPRAVVVASAGATLALVTLAAPSPARANGRFPASNQIVFAPADPRLVVLRSTFGILLSHDAGATWSWLCEDALGLRSVSSEDPSVGITANGSLVAGVSWALETSTDIGCSWALQGGALHGKPIVDLSVRRNAPHSIVAVQSQYELDAGTPSGWGFATQVFESSDDGANWAPLGVPLDPSVTVATIDTAPGDPHRLYVSGQRWAAAGGGAEGPASLFVSVDDGATWNERPLPALPADAGTAPPVFIAAVDPGNTDRVYLRTASSVSGQGSTLFLTEDAGRSYRVLLSFGGPMLGFALSPDSTRVYAGGPEDGLWGSTVKNGIPGPFAKISPLHVQCLASSGSELWACSDEASGFIAGVSSNGGTCFAPKLHFTEVTTPIACPADAAAAKCSGQPFQMLCENLGTCPDPDAAPGPAGVPADAASACVGGFEAGEEGGLVEADASPDEGPAGKGDAGETAGEAAGEGSGAAGGGGNPGTAAPGTANPNSSSCALARDPRGSVAGLLLGVVATLAWWRARSARTTGQEVSGGSDASRRPGDRA
jgi:hypothetical protein